MKSFFAGLGLGAIVGLLTAPKSGAQSRKSLSNLVNKSLEDGRSFQKTPANEPQKQTSTLPDNDVGELAPKAQGSERPGLMTILNDWPHERLIEIDGIGPVLATKIIRLRPYDSINTLIASKELPPSAIQSIRDAA